MVGAVLSSPLEQQQQQLQQQPQQQQRQQPPYASPILFQSNYRDEAREPDYLDEQDGQYREELYNNINTIPGVPGVDYPTLATIPRSAFSCSDKLPGFYADEEARCQVWHYCKTDGLKESFLCPNGTIYNQANRVCEWWFNVLCEDTLAAYRVNEDLYIIPSSTPEPDQQGVLRVQGVQGSYNYPERDDTQGYYTE